MKFGFIFILIFLIARFSFAQNLVPNPSFEDTLPHGGYCYGPIEWTNHWFNPTLSTPDLFCYNSTSLNCTVSSLNNPTGFQNPRSGFAYAGIYTWAGETREYIAVLLDSALSGDCTYYIEFYLSRADNFGFATDKIGCAFTNDTNNLDTTIFYLPLMPAIESQPGVLMTDSQNWVRVNGFYTAQGNERYLIIGNFHENSNTYVDTSNITLYYSAYYYIDDVKLLSCDSTLVLSEMELNKQTKAKEISIYPNPVNNVLNIFHDASVSIENIEIFDQTGELLLRQKLRNSQQQISMSVATIKTGVYLLKIILLNGTQIHSKIFIIH